MLKVSIQPLHSLHGLFVLVFSISPAERSMAMLQWLWCTRLLWLLYAHSASWDPSLICKKKKEMKKKSTSCEGLSNLTSGYSLFSGRRTVSLPNKRFSDLFFNFKVITIVATKYEAISEFSSIKPKWPEPNKSLIVILKKT